MACYKVVKIIRNKENQEYEQKIQAIEQDIAQVSKIIEDYDKTMTMNKIIGTSNKNKEDNYRTRSETVTDKSENLMLSSRVNGNPPSTTPKQKDQNRSRQSYLKNEKCVQGTCNLGCNIF